MRSRRASQNFHAPLGLIRRVPLCTSSTDGALRVVAAFDDDLVDGALDEPAPSPSR